MSRDVAVVVSDDEMVMMLQNSCDAHSTRNRTNRLDQINCCDLRNVSIQTNRRQKQIESRETRRRGEQGRGGPTVDQ
jgi:hypothetical protein